MNPKDAIIEMMANCRVRQWDQNIGEDGAEALFAHLSAAGYAIVPVEPTTKMLEAFWMKDDSPGLPYAGPEPRDAYQCMIRAANKEG